MAEYKVRVDCSVYYDDSLRIYEMTIVDDPVEVLRLPDNMLGKGDRSLYTSRARCYNHKEDKTVEVYYRRVYCTVRSAIPSLSDPLKLIWDDPNNVDSEWLTFLVEEKLAKEQNNG